MYLKKRFFILLLAAVSLLCACAGGGIFAKAGQIPEAGQNIETYSFPGDYLSIGPDGNKSLGKLGFWYFKTGRLNEAIAEFETALKKDPEDPFSIYYLGLVYLNMEEYEKTIQVWKKYRNKTNPRVEEEIERHLTIIQIAQSRKYAEKAIAEEKNISIVKPDSNTVAICYYQDLSSDNSLRAFQKGLAAMVISDLTKIKSLRVVERIRLQAVLEEMNLGLTGLVDSRTAPRVGRLLGAKNIVFGSLAPGSIKAVTALATSDEGSVIGSASVSVDKEKFFELPMAIVRETAKIMGIVLTDDEKKAIRIPHTKVYKALVYFGQALDAMDAGKWKEAYEYFNMAYKEDPGFVLAKEGADTCPGIDYPSLNSLSSISGAMLSARVESLVSAAGGTKPVFMSLPEILSGDGFTVPDNIGIDSGALGSSGVNLEGMSPVGKTEEPVHEQTYIPPSEVNIVESAPPVVVTKVPVFEQTYTPPSEVNLGGTSSVGETKLQVY